MAVAKKIDCAETASRVEEVVEALARTARDASPFPVIQEPAGADALPGLRRLGKSELATLSALLAYTAHEQQVLQETVQAIVEAHFGVRHMSAIRAADFGAALSFIAGLRVDQRIN
jgi:hypothetical protein